jgi:hypothetical protein
MIPPMNLEIFSNCSSGEVVVMCLLFLTVLTDHTGLIGMVYEGRNHLVENWQGAILTAMRQHV